MSHEGYANRSSRRACHRESLAGDGTGKRIRGHRFQDDFGHSLADAPLTTEARAQIYDVVDAGLHGVFANDQLEREAVLSARVDSIKLARRGPKQIFVRVSRRMCGATGNCEMFVFVRQRGKAENGVRRERLRLER